MRREQARQSAPAPKRKRKKIKKPVVLRTKRISISIPATSDASDLDDDHDAHECAICLGLLEHGDVVGDIPCGHLFHKDCLKVWIKRKTRCPLCQDEGLVCSPTNEKKGEKETTCIGPISGRTLGMTDSESASDTDPEAPLETDVEIPSEPDAPSEVDDQLL